MRREAERAAQAEFERQQREQQRQAEEARKQAELEAQRQQAELERQQREEQRQAEEARKQAELEAQRQQAELERQQRREQEQAQREAEKARQAAERDARRQQAELERQQRREQEQAQREAEKARQAAERDAQRQQGESERQRRQQAEEQARAQRDADRGRETSGRQQQADNPARAQREVDGAKEAADRAEAQRRQQADADRQRQQQQQQPQPQQPARVEQREADTERPRDWQDAGQRPNDVARAGNGQRPRQWDDDGPGDQAADVVDSDKSGTPVADDRPRDRSRQDGRLDDRSNGRDRDTAGDRNTGRDGDVARDDDTAEQRARAIEERQAAARREYEERRKLAERVRREAEQGQIAPLPSDGEPDVADTAADGAGATPGSVVETVTGAATAVVKVIGAAVSPPQKPVAWLNGFQQQASHLGVKPGEDADTGEAETADSGTTTTNATTTTASAPPQAVAPEPPVEEVIKKAETELVVTGLSTADVETVKKLGGSVTSSGTSSTQRIDPPADVTKEKFRQLLNEQIWSAEFTDNHVYTIFLGSLGESDAVGLAKAAPASSKPCPGDTCFASRLIHWRNSLRSCTKNVKIGIIDTSFDTTHPAFKNLAVEQGEFLDGQRPSPYDWHGTAVLSLLAGDPSSGTPGLIPDATFLLATAFRSDAAGNASTDTVRLLKALEWLESRGVQYINMSFSGPRDPKFEKAIQRLRKNGVVFVAAAGNLGPTAPPSYPAAYPEVIAVTAVNRDGENYRHANRGDYIDVSAPGVDILAALPDAQQGYRTGTSFAAPFVTAIVATRGGEVRPVPKARLLKQLSMKDLGPPGRDPIYGTGLAQAPATCTGGSDQIAKDEPPVKSLPAAQVVPAVRSGSAPVAKIEAKFEPAGKNPAPAAKSEPTTASALGAWSTTTTLIKARTSSAPQ